MQGLKSAVDRLCRGQPRPPRRFKKNLGNTITDPTPSHGELSTWDYQTLRADSGSTITTKGQKSIPILTKNCFAGCR